MIMDGHKIFQQDSEDIMEHRSHQLLNSGDDSRPCIEIRWRIVRHRERSVECIEQRIRHHDGCTNDSDQGPIQIKQCLMHGAPYVQQLPRW